MRKLQREIRGDYEECKFALLPIYNKIFETNGAIDDFKVFYPKVPKQTNWRDCGVFVIMFAKALLLQVKKTFNVSWEKLVAANDVESNGRTAIHDYDYVSVT
ncbi:hypothetical protein CHS0354_022529 [Potamilus streckersoni]|uniref:Ubiquitin-like protease family profile domain-containing protein n=1 Tax=Potamilus streckersoni TaxID=2493646 RepID=A0AAE0S7D3_9BIVA|nr:hypothetical protein CHS0354_022529 [Potamilus streckersoni]